LSPAKANICQRHLPAAIHNFFHASAIENNIIFAFGLTAELSPKALIGTTERENNKFFPETVSSH
jgi:hypothetical protein